MTRAKAPRGHVQIPRSLIYSPTHSALAVWTWAMYETLMPHALNGTRAPAIARRSFLAERANTSTTALDDARRQLLTPTQDGPYLSRSTPRGAKRSVLHAALRRPRETGERYAPVPAWTLDMVWAGRHRPAGTISAEAWRLYTAAVDRAHRNGKPTPFDTTTARLAAALNTSQPTARRRLAELEAAGLIEATARPGGWLTLRVVLEEDDATQTAEHYATHGRRHANPHRNPSHVAALTPLKNRHTPLPTTGTPQETPPTYSPPEEPPPLPAAGAYSNQSAQTPETGKAGKPTHHQQDRRTPTRIPRAAIDLYRALPPALTHQIPEHGSQRVLKAIAAELQHRTPAELANRITRNWDHRRYHITDTDPIRDPVAVATRLVRRGHHCPDVRCEDGHQLDLNTPCKACAQVTELKHSEPAPCLTNGTSTEPHSHTPDRRKPTSPARYPKEQNRHTIWQALHATRPATIDGRPYAALARQLLKARTDVEREAIISAHHTPAPTG
ncbi:winged helix-turn-helix domain-containing protein [Actinomadura terrae]|uniref:winged helix-turn-helix domain-containing protein n=1 Tax=Actinomadura terrae TaxID=604353 RepID=UPI001FA7A183|nr:winged helix-turn-helix domain-containing protein [Actinomadura terrae]